MKLDDVRVAYQDSTSAVSDRVRQLGFAAIAIIWVFRVEASGGDALPQSLLMPGLLVIAALVMDFLQFVVKAATWGIYGRLKELRDVTADDEFVAPPELNWGPIILFWLKVVAISSAYVMLGSYLLGRIV